MGLFLLASSVSHLLINSSKSVNCTLTADLVVSYRILYVHIFLVKQNLNVLSFLSFCIPWTIHMYVFKFPNI